MTTPKRIQLKRTKGWRKPEGAVVVARPSKWGNPYRAGNIDMDTGEERTAEEAVRLFRTSVEQPEVIEQIRRELAGKDLACWCPLVDASGNPVPCHADVLLEIANGGTP